MRPSRLSAIVLPLAILVAAAPARSQQARRPTPQQLIVAALRPIEDQLASVHATDPERAGLRDVTVRAEAFAAALVEARHRGSDDVAHGFERRIELLARIARGRIEAARASDEARERERVALAAEARRTQARAALDRVVERRVELDRPPPAPIAPVAPVAPAESVAPVTPPPPRRHATRPATPAAPVSTDAGTRPR